MTRDLGVLERARRTGVSAVLSLSSSTAGRER